MKGKKLVSMLLCTTVLSACLTMGASAATLKDRIYSDNNAIITNVVSYDEDYTVLDGGPGLPIHCVAPVKVTPNNPTASYSIQNFMDEGQYIESTYITKDGIEITEPGEYVISYGGTTPDGNTYLGDYYLIVNSGNDSTPLPSEGAFTDVPTDAYYADAVTWAVDKGITSGTGANQFSPDATCTTAQILTFLWRANGSPAPTGSNAAIPAGQYYTDATNWALEQGLTDSLNVDTPSTRSDIVTYLWKLAGKPAAKHAASFTDVAADAPYADAVAWAVEQGITSGTGANNFSPDVTCTRGQIVTFLYRDLAE